MALRITLLLIYTLGNTDYNTVFVGDRFFLFLKVGYTGYYPLVLSR